MGRAALDDRPIHGDLGPATAAADVSVLPTARVSSAVVHCVEFPRVGVMMTETPLLNDGLGERLRLVLLSGQRPKDRIRALRDFVVALRPYATEVAIANHGAEILAAAAAQLPIRDTIALHGQYGDDPEVA